MLYSFNKCLEKYGNLHQINKMVEPKQLYKFEPSIYTDKERVSELEVVSFKYSHAIFTMDSNSFVLYRLELFAQKSTI